MLSSVGDLTAIASAAAAAEMAEFTPEMMAEIMRAAPEMGEAGEYLLHCFGAFDFDGIVHTPPTSTFSGQKSILVGDKQVELIEVGPAHTAGDVLVHVPAEKTVFTGDILFIDGTPIIWAGPVSNWVKACDRIMAMDVESIVPGHGPITDKAGVKQVRDYLTFLDEQARARFDAGMPVTEAVRDIALGEYRNWLDAERIAVNVNTLFREYRGETEAGNTMESIGLMAEVWRELKS